MIGRMFMFYMMFICMGFPPVLLWWSKTVNLSLSVCLTVKKHSRHINDNIVSLSSSCSVLCPSSRMQVQSPVWHIGQELVKRVPKELGKSVCACFWKRQQDSWMASWPVYSEYSAVPSNLAQSEALTWVSAWCCLFQLAVAPKHLQAKVCPVAPAVAPAVA